MYFGDAGGDQLNGNIYNIYVMKFEVESHILMLLVFGDAV